MSWNSASGFTHKTLCLLKVYKSGGWLWCGNKQLWPLRGGEPSGFSSCSYSTLMLGVDGPDPSQSSWGPGRCRHRLSHFPGQCRGTERALQSALARSCSLVSSYMVSVVSCLGFSGGPGSAVPPSAWEEDSWGLEEWLSSLPYRTHGVKELFPATSALHLLGDQLTVGCPSNAFEKPFSKTDQSINDL